MLTTRGANEVVFYTGGRLIHHTIADGDRVTLRSGDQNVLVRDVEVLGQDRFAGIIFGFEPSFSERYNDLELNQRIEFHESNVFGCDGA